MNNISLEELKFVSPRIVLYVAMAYAATRVVKFGINQTAKLIGVKTDRA